MQSLKSTLPTIFTSGLIVLGLSLATSTPAWAISEQSVDDEWLDEAYMTLELVKLYDRNNDRLLSDAEMQQGMSGDFQRFDSNRDGQLSLSEFETLWNTELQQAMQQEFRSIDTDHSQDLSVPELVVNYKQTEKRLFAGSCLNYDAAIEQEFNQEARLEIAELDRNSDGLVNYPEFSNTPRQHMVEDFRDIDTDSNGQLTQAEYQAALKDLAMAATELKRDLPIQC